VEKDLVDAPIAHQRPEADLIPENRRIGLLD